VRVRLGLEKNAYCAAMVFPWDAISGSGCPVTFGAAAPTVKESELLGVPSQS